MSDVGTLSPDDFDAAASLVRQLTGLVFPASRRPALERALLEATARAGLGDLPTFLSRLSCDQGLLDDLAGHITIAESYFFRDPQQLALIAEVVSDLAGARRCDSPLRIWSAGCAAGEESYTLAILLQRLGLSGRTHILGTDLSRAALARARRGRYSRWALRSIPEEVIATYFRRAGQEFELAPAIRDAVEFRYLNLAEGTYPSLAAGVWGMDLILCRNVLIYFDADTVTRVVRRMVASLGEDGWLVLGASDPPIAERVECHVVVTKAGLAYRRPGRRASAMQPMDKRAERLEPAPPRSEELEPPRAHATEPVIESPGARVGDAPPREEEMSSESGTERADDAAASATLVRSMANEGRLSDAGRACAAALDRYRTSAELAYLHAVLLAEAGHPREAVMAARRALYLDPRLVVAHLALGAVLARLHDVAGARRAFTNAERLLSAARPGDVVPCSDGESAGRLAEIVRVELRLLREAAA